MSSKEYDVFGAKLAPQIVVGDLQFNLPSERYTNNKRPKTDLQSVD